MFASILISNCILGSNAKRPITKYDPSDNVSIKSVEQYDGNSYTSSVSIVE